MGRIGAREPREHCEGRREKCGFLWEPSPQTPSVCPLLGTCSAGAAPARSQGSSRAIVQLPKHPSARRERGGLRQPPQPLCLPQPPAPRALPSSLPSPGWKQSLAPAWALTARSHRPWLLPP